MTASMKNGMKKQIQPESFPSAVSAAISRWSFTRSRIVEAIVSMISARLPPTCCWMTTAVTTIGPRAMAIEALRMMHDGGFRHVPVVADGVVRGVVSRSDFKGDERTRLEEETSLFEAVR